jgi:hypothetical protein
MKLTIEYDKLTLETRLNTYSFDRAPLESEDAWYDFTEFATLNLWYSDDEYKAAVYPVTDAGDVMHEYGTQVEIITKDESHKLAITLASTLDVLKACKKSIRHAAHCKAPQALPCSCDADQLWETATQAIKKADFILANHED